MVSTTRLTTARAIVKFPDNQYVSMDGAEVRFVEGFFTNDAWEDVKTGQDEA